MVSGVGVLPYCMPNDTHLHSPHYIARAFEGQRYMIGVVYVVGWFLGFFPQLLCLYAICHKHHLKYPCYVLMLYVCILDMCNLTTSLLISGIFSIFDVQHCRDGYIVIAVGYATLTLWFAYCAAAMILAVNRVLEFTSKVAVEFLFSGYRCWLWLFVIVGYAAGVQCTVKAPFYYYNPDEGSFNFFTIGESTNINHVVNNFVKFAFVTVAYAIMWILLKVKIRKGGALRGQISTLEANLSIQALAVGILAAFSTVGYLSFSYLPVAHVPLMGALGELLWASVHGGSAYIYLIMNKSIRSAAFKPFRRRCLSMVAVVTVTAPSWTKN